MIKVTMWSVENYGDTTELNITQSERSTVGGHAPGKY